MPPPLWRARLALLTISIVALLSCRVAGTLITETDSPSLLIWLAVAGTGSLGITSLIGLFLPAPLLSRLLATFSHQIQQVLLNKPAESVRQGQVLVIVGISVFLLHAGRQWSFADSPWDDDQGAFLQTASQIHHQGGILPFLRELWTGEFEEANRHPLYLAFLSIHPTPFFGRMLSTCFGTILVFGTTWFAVRRWGWLAGGVVCLLVASNGAVITFSGRIVCETLLLLLTSAAWFSVWKWPQFEQSPYRQAALIGLFLGFAWLTKGTALLLLFGWILVTLVPWIAALLRNGAGKTVHQPLFAVGLALLSFVLVSSPLISRNIIRYGNPFYNVNAQLLFVDQYSDPTALADRQSTGEAARQYWEEHTLAQLLWREAHGLVWESYIILRSLGPAPWDDGRVLLGLPLFLCACLGALSTPGFPRGVTASWGGLLWIVFAWYVPIAAGERFILPLTVPLLVAAALGLVRLFHKSPTRLFALGCLGAGLSVLMAIWPTIT